MPTRPLTSAEPVHLRRGSDDLTLRSARRFAAVALACAAACSRAAPAPAARSGESNGATPAVSPVGTDADAIDLLVVMHAITVARQWGPAPELAAALKARVARYEGRVQLEFAIEGVDDSVTAEGVRTGIPPSARFGATLAGALHGTIHVAGGEVGLVRGDVHVAEGTLATVDGRAYRRADGRWLPAATAGR